MTFPWSSPVVSVARGAGMGHKVVVAGGGSHFRVPRAGHRVVEVFDSEIGTWEFYGDLPEEFSYFNSRTSMSGVVCDNKFYVSKLRIYETDKVRIHFLDLFTKQRACILLEPPEALIYHHIMATGTTLVAAGICGDASNEQYAVRLWKVDMKSLCLIQIGSMPRELAALVESAYDDDLPLTSMVDENLVYFSMVNGELVLAEDSLKACRTDWRLLPAHPVMGCSIPFDGWITFLASIGYA